MASEFVYVLIAGVAVLVIGGVLAGFASETAVGDGRPGAPIFSEDLGTIGDIEATSRTIRFGDIIVEARSEESQVASRDTVSVGSNVLGASSQTIRFDSEGGDRVHISFAPSKSAAPENLIVRVNGERVSVGDYTVGEQVSLTTSNIRQGENTATFSAERPGTRFWRTPSYTLRNVVVSVTSPRTVEPFRAFEYEVEGFDRGEVSFSITQDVVRDAPLRVAINGNTVMSRTPVPRALPYDAAFHANTTDLSAGENVLSLSTSGESSYPLEDVSLTMYFFAGTQQRTVVRDFELSGEQYSRIGQDDGRITLEVDRVTLPRPVTVTLPNATFTRTLDAGTNTFEFGQGAVMRGSNTVTVSTDGSYRVSNMTISVAE